MKKFDNLLKGEIRTDNVGQRRIKNTRVHSSSVERLRRLHMWLILCYIYIIDVECLSFEYCIHIHVWFS